VRRAIGVDLGGTKIAAGIVDEAGTITARHEMPSDLDDATSVARQIAELVRALGPGDGLGIGIGAAGIVDFSTGYYTFGPNTGLHDIGLAGIVAKETGVTVRVDNDANCAAWAEHRFGVGRGTSNFMCVTLGTGIGGGLVIDGRPYRGAHGGAAEIGHMLIDPDGPPCGCGRRGCWEQYASGLAMERVAREEIGAHPESSLSAAQPLRGPAITLAARDGDAFAKQIVDETATWVGWGLGSLVNVLEPECIAIAGGIVRDWDLFAERAHDAMLERMESSSRRPVPKLLAASLGADAGIVGGALLVLDGAN
jgi:glucokinase